MEKPVVLTSFPIVLYFCLSAFKNKNKSLLNLNNHFIDIPALQ